MKHVVKQSSEEIKSQNEIDLKKRGEKLKPFFDFLTDLRGKRVFVEISNLPFSFPFWIQLIYDSTKALSTVSFLIQIVQLPFIIPNSAFNIFSPD